MTWARVRRTLYPELPRPVQTLQLGGLCSAFGNGAVLPFTLIYLHNVREISLAVAGAVIATNAAVSLVAGPVAGPLVDRLGGRAVLGLALCFLAVGYGGYALVHVAWQAVLAAVLTGVGNGLFWPAQSTLLAALTPPHRRHTAFAMQRVMMNLGIGLGALMGGAIASSERPGTFTALFLVDAATFLVYLGVALALVPAPDFGRRDGERAGTYRDVLRHRAFVGVVALNAIFIFGGFAGLELLPVYAKNEASVSETAIGVVFFVNTLVIVVAQLPISRLSEGRRRMQVLALLGVVWAGAWLLVPIAGTRLVATSAAVLLGVSVSIFGLGECLHGAVQAPLVADLAEPTLLGRYMALSALSWQVGFALGPAVGAVVLSVWPTGAWLGAAAVCLGAGALALALERSLPASTRRTPTAAKAA